MFERFTKDARAIVVGAQEHARWLGSSSIEPEHLLLSALTGDGSPGDLLRRAGVSADRLERAITGEARDRLDGPALASLGIDLDTVRRRADELFGPGALDATGDGGRAGRPGHIRFGPASKKVLELALREAIHLGDVEITSDHVLLGLARPRTAGEAAVRRGGGDPALLRRAVLARRDAA